MPDQNNLDPQAAVDAVLGGAVNTTTTTPAIEEVRKEEVVEPKIEELPTLEPLEQKSTEPVPTNAPESTQQVELPKQEVVPTELVAPLTEVNVVTNEITQKENVVAKTTEEQVKVESVVTPISVPEQNNIQPPSMTVGDNTPLAFVGASPEPQVSVEPAPIANNIPSVEVATSPKKGKKKIGMLIVGLVALGIFSIGGVVGYQYLTTGTSPLIAGVDGGMDTLTGNSRGGNTAVINDNNDETDDYSAAQERAERNAEIREERAREAEEAAREQGRIEDAARLRAEADAIAAAAAAASAQHDQTIDELKSQCDEDEAFFDGNKCTYPAGTNPNNPPAVFVDIPLGGDCGSSYTGSCAGGGGVCENGKCIALSACPGGDPSKCPVTCNDQQMATWIPVTEPGGRASCESGRVCRPYRVERREPGTNQHCFVRGDANCSEAEDCSPGDTLTELPPPSIDGVTPTMSCSSITAAPAAPVLGNTVTLTCLGAVTPSTAGTLSYKFRYSINGGTYTTLTNATATTASLSIAACGTYSVQCQACATLNGVLTCDPTWTGATTN